jgi:hypothetical protein
VLRAPAPIEGIVSKSRPCCQAAATTLVHVAAASSGASQAAMLVEPPAGPWLCQAGPKAPATPCHFVSKQHNFRGGRKSQGHSAWHHQLHAAGAGVGSRDQKGQ